MSSLTDANDPPAQSTVDDDNSVSSEESSEDDLVLDGELIRNPDAPSSSDDEDAEEEKKRPPDADASSSTKKKARADETLKVEFTFCDMAEKYFHGLKNLLHSSSCLYAQHSSNLADLMIENVSVGTVVSTATDADGDVYGFASVLNVSTFQKAVAIQFLKSTCLDNCSSDRKEELKVILSGSTKRPAGFMLHGRMLNLPLEMVLALHQQLIKDIDWAIENAEGGKEEQKSLDFGLFLRLAPCHKENSVILYKYFDDEILSDRAEFVYDVKQPPKSADAGTTEQQHELIKVMVLTKAGHRAAIDDLARMVNG